MEFYCSAGEHQSKHGDQHIHPEVLQITLLPSACVLAMFRKTECVCFLQHCNVSVLRYDPDRTSSMWRHMEVMCLYKNVTVPKRQKREVQDEHYGLLSEGWELQSQSSCLQMAPLPSPKLRSYGCPCQLCFMLASTSASSAVT